VQLRKCGRFHELEPEQYDQPEPRARAVRWNAVRAVCTHRQDSHESVARTRAHVVWIRLEIDVRTVLLALEHGHVALKRSILEFILSCTGDDVA
jgi:hypothetical protein